MCNSWTYKNLKINNFLITAENAKYLDYVSLLEYPDMRRFYADLTEEQWQESDDTKDAY